MNLIVQHVRDMLTKVPLAGIALLACKIVCHVEIYDRNHRILGFPAKKYCSKISHVLTFMMAVLVCRLGAIMPSVQGYC